MHANPEALKEGGKNVLPAIAPIASVSAIAPTTATASTTVAAAITAPTTAVTATAATAARAFGLRAGFVHYEVPTAKILTVQTGHRAIRVFIASDFDEREAARLASKTVANQADGRRADSQLSEPLLQLLF